jgi:hypothetical protein
MDEEEEVKEEVKFVYVDGHFTNLEALARKIQGTILAAGGEVKTDEDASSSALAGFDLGAHVTDDMDEDRLGQLLEEFDEAWVAAAAGPGKAGGE